MLVIAACSQLHLKSVSKPFENVEWSNSLLKQFKIQTLLKINCCMAAISAFRVTQHSQIFFLLFFRNRIQCIALYQLYNSQALLNLRRGYFRVQIKDSFIWYLLAVVQGNDNCEHSCLCLDKCTVVFSTMPHAVCRSCGMHY